MKYLYKLISIILSMFLYIGVSGGIVYQYHMWFVKKQTPVVIIIQPDPNLERLI